MIETLLRLLRKGDKPKARESVYRAFGPSPLPQDHSCLKEPFPWRIAVQTRHQLLRPCPFCGHAIAAHTYDRPCPLCELEHQVTVALRPRKR